MAALFVIFAISAERCIWIRLHIWCVEIIIIVKELFKRSLLSLEDMTWWSVEELWVLCSLLNHLSVHWWWLLQRLSDEVVEWTSLQLLHDPLWLQLELNFLCLLLQVKYL